MSSTGSVAVELRIVESHYTAAVVKLVTPSCDATPIWTAPGFPEARLRGYGQLGCGRLAVVVDPLELVGRNGPERLQQAMRVVPRHPLQRGELDVLDASPGPAATDLPSCKNRSRIRQARCRTNRPCSQPTARCPPRRDVRCTGSTDTARHGHCGG